MTPELQTTPPPVPALPVLTSKERRVLGVLVEKAKTTPDAYPLSLNALVTGCNQKSNREPVLNLAEGEVEETVVGLMQKGLVLQITGGRVERWRHKLYEAWHLGKVELAVLAELLLRGPQTEGELRGRASRMESITDLDALRSLLRPLAERRLVVYLSPEGRRGTVLTHGFHASDELDRLRTAHPVEATSPAEDGPSPSRPSPDALAGLETRLAQACAAIADLQERVSRLEQQVKG
jgi:uncharacterized protein YceH (UPF0502 family)